MENPSPSQTRVTRLSNSFEFSGDLYRVRQLIDAPILRRYQVSSIKLDHLNTLPNELVHVVF